MEVPPAQELPQRDGIEAGVSRELALGPYSCEGDKALPEPLEERPKLLLPHPFPEPGPGSILELIARPLHDRPA